MKVLWFEISQPSGYEHNGRVTCMWQDALEEVVRGHEGVDLYIAFESTTHTEIRKQNGVTYIPLHTSYSWWENKRKQWTWDVNEKKVLAGALKVIEDVKPNLIHVFGNEWPFGLVAEKVRDIPVVIHIQGSIVPYNNALYPPGYSEQTMKRYAGINPIIYWRLWKSRHKSDTNLTMELRTWKCVRHYMGRTIWDKSLVNVLSPTSSYYHVDEALRPSFLATTRRWNPIKDGKLRLITTGLSNFWKGPDMLLKTAHVLMDLGVDFEWKVAGNLGKYYKYVIEKKEGMTFVDNNVKILGFTQPEELINILCESTIYVHTAYIENSPNSICEAQYLGLPVVSTHVGGIETLLDGGNDGVLVPANDPWRMANAILELAKDNNRMRTYGENGYKHAHSRHKPENILHDLMSCYKLVIEQQH